MLSCLIRVFQKRSFFLLSFSGVRRTPRNGTDGWWLCALPACFGEGREGGEREREHCFCLHARSPSRFHPRRYSALPPLARSLAHPLPLPSLPPSPIPVCLAFSLRRPHLPPFLLCTCVSAPGVCGRWRADGRRRDDVEAAITPVRVSERSFSIFLRIAPRATSWTILR